MTPMPEAGTPFSAFTWDPVTAAWVHERGPEIAPPPPPPDVHALQTYFFEPDSKQWIRTVLADRGRELAAQFRGAHVIPKDGAAPAVTNKDDKKKKGSPMPLVAIVVVLLLVIGGIGVFASQSGLLASSVLPATSSQPSVAASVAASVAPSAAAASPSDSAAPTESAAPRTQAPVRTAPPPAGISTRMPDGTVVTYTGPTVVVKPASLAVTMTVTSANGRPASGTITILIHGVNAVAPLDGNGRVALNLGTANLEPSTYPLQVLYQGASATVTQITVR